MPLRHIETMSYPLSHHGYTPNTMGTGDPALSVSSEVPALASANPPSAGGSTARTHKRKSTKPGTGKQLSRSTSTPQLAGVGSMSDEDKKRNKLGYQRISIACAHCRRRKIRCLLADGDPHSRCHNCIRLKRECVFYPVEQQGTVESQSQASSKTGAPSLPSSGVSPSPSDMNPSKAYERERQFGGFPPLPSNAPPGFQVMEPGTAVPGQGDLIPSFTAHSMTEADATRLPHPDYQYGSHSEGHQQWGTPDSFNPQRHTMTGQSNESAQPSYWRPSLIVPSGDFAPFSGGGPAMDQMHATPSYTYQPPEMQPWQSQPPNQSMSYDELRGGTQSSYLASNMMYQQHSGVSTGPATYPPLDVHRAAMPISMPGPHSTPIGTPIAPFTQAPPYIYQPAGTLSASPLPTSSYHQGVWYPESSPYGSREHQVQSTRDPGPYTTEAPR